MAESGECGAAAHEADPYTAEEMMAMAAELLARAEARVGPRPGREAGIQGSRAAAEWRAELFEELASLVA